MQVLGFSTKRSLGRLIAVLGVGVAFLAIATPAHATFPGANGKLLFTRGTGTGSFTKLSTMNPDGSGVADVTNANANDSSGAWSPNGAKIAFASNRDDPANDKIYVVNGDGTGVTRLTNSAGRDSSPAWSPDGTKIAFVRYPGTGNNEYIYVINSDGTNEHQLADLRGAFGLASGGNLEWSPDGTKIALDGNGNDIYVMKADGTSILKLTNNSCCSSDHAASNPTWSPDGKKIAFTQNYLTGDVGTGDVEVINPDGTGRVDITQGFCDDERVRAWSPDGSRIWFLEDLCPSGDYTDAFINPDGTNVFTIPAWVNGTDWQPLPRVNYAHPQSAVSLSSSLVPAFKKCGTGGNPVNARHASPLASGSCSPPSPSSAVARVGAGMQGSAQLSVIPGDTDPTNGNQADVALTTSLTDVQAIAGGDYNPASGADLTQVARLRLTDQANGYGGVPATVADVDFPVPIDCAPTADAFTGSTCTATTTADTLMPGLIREQRQAVVQIFRVRVYDSGRNGTRENGTGDDKEFAHEGIFAP